MSIPKITLYAHPGKLKQIDLYCVEKGLSRSEFLINCALSVINRSKDNIRCEYCANPAVGKFKILAWDSEKGEMELEKNLCQKHITQAKKEGAVVRDV